MHECRSAWGWLGLYILFGDCRGLCKLQWNIHCLGGVSWFLSDACTKQTKLNNHLTDNVSSSIYFLTYILETSFPWVKEEKKGIKTLPNTNMNTNHICLHLVWQIPWNKMLATDVGLKDPQELPKGPFKLVSMFKGQEEPKKEAGHSRFVGGRYNKQGNILGLVCVA